MTEQRIPKPGEVWKLGDQDRWILGYEPIAEQVWFKVNPDSTTTYLASKTGYEGSWASWTPPALPIPEFQLFLILDTDWVDDSSIYRTLESAVQDCYDDSPIIEISYKDGQAKIVCHK